MTVQVNSVKRQYSCGTPKATFGGDPNWDKIPSSGMQRPSEDEFKNIIEQLGERWANIKTDRDYANVKNEIDKAAAQYISTVSPDRKQLLNEALPTIHKVQNNRNKGTDCPPDLLDILDGIQNYNPMNRGSFQVKMEGETAITFYSNGMGPYHYEVTSGTESVPLIGNLNGQWTYGLTKQERTMEIEFYNKLNAAYVRNNGQSSTQAITETRLNIQV